MTPRSPGLGASAPVSAVRPGMPLSVKVGTEVSAREPSGTLMNAAAPPSTVRRPISAREEGESESAPARSVSIDLAGAGGTSLLADKSGFLRACL
eukprot:scaffold97176_cov29-Tisochrysis_lutea.AAC.3